MKRRRDFFSQLAGKEFLHQMDAQPRVLNRALRRLTGLHAVDEMPVFKIVAIEFVEVIAAGQFTTVQNDAFLLRGSRGGQRIAWRPTNS